MTQAHPELNYEYGRRVLGGMLDNDVALGRLTNEEASELKAQVRQQQDKRREENGMNELRGAYGNSLLLLSLVERNRMLNLVRYIPSSVWRAHVVAAMDRIT